MTAYKSAQLTAPNMPVQSHGMASNVLCDRFKVTVGAAMTTADTIEFGELPIFARVVDMAVKATDMDTNGSPTLAFNVGDAGDADRYFAATQVGRAGTVERMSLATGFGYQYTTKGNKIIGAVTTNAATGAAGTIELFVSYVIEDTGVGYPS